MARLAWSQSISSVLFLKTRSSRAAHRALDLLYVGLLSAEIWGVYIVAKLLFEMAP